VGGYFAADRGVIRFHGGVHAFLLQATVGRFIRTGHVAPFCRQDDERYPSLIVPIGSRFLSPLVWSVRKAWWRSRRNASR
jgi:hypothetical protein